LVAAAPGNRLDWLGQECVVFYRSQDTHDVKPAEAAVDRDKQRGLSAVADEYLRHVTPSTFVPVALRCGDHVL
jgi:hypothetical protein